MGKKRAVRSVTNENLMAFLVGMDERMTNMDEKISEIKETVATKDDLEKLKEEIIEPIMRAVDKDAETLYDHGKRIASLEKHVGISAR